jgi:hypothetical protein
VKADVFRPQSAGRAVRTAFVLGVLVVIAIVAAVGAIGNFTALVGNPSKDDLSRYLDDNAHTGIRPSDAGFKLDFPAPPTRQSERVATDGGSVDAKRDGVVIDDEISFEVVWFDLPGSGPIDGNKVLSSMITRQMRQLGATKVAVSTTKKVGAAAGRDFVAVKVEESGLKRYFDEEIILKGRHVWMLRIGSHIRRDAAFVRFTGSFKLTG